MTFRALTLILVAALAVLSPVPGPGGFARADATARKAKPAVVAGVCAKFYAKLAGFKLPENLGFLPKRLRDELGDIANLLRLDERAAGERAFTFHPELKRLVDELQAIRREHVDLGVKLRAERRALRDRIGMSAARNRLSRAEAEQTMRSVLDPLERQLEKNGERLESLVRVLEPLRGALGLGAIAEAAHQTARELNAVVVLHDLQPAAAGLLSHKGVGKGKRFKFNSTDEGAIAGLTPYDQSLSAKVRAQGAAVVAAKQAEVEEAIRHGLVAKRPHRVGSLVAVKKNGTVKFVDEEFARVRPEEIAYVLEEVSPDGTGRLIVSDVDPAAFGFAKDRSAGSRPGLAAGTAPREHPSMGIITEHEREVILTFNRRTETLLGHENDRLRYMTHGAENRNPFSKGPTGYPMAAFLPNGERRLIELGPAADPHVNYRNFIREMDAAGYEIPVNPLWGWDPSTYRATKPAPGPSPGARPSP